MATRPVAARRRRTNTDQHRWLLVQNLPEDVSSDTLLYHFESKRQFGRELSVENVELNTEEDWAVITFERASDALTVINIHNKTPTQVDGQTLDVVMFDGDIENTVLAKKSAKKRESQGSKPAVNCEAIEVRGFSDSSTKESLQYYFENVRRSGGGPIHMCRIDKENGCLLLHFEDQSVVDAVLNRKHVVENCTLILRKIEMSTKQLVFSDISDTTSEDLLINFLESRLPVTVEAMFIYREINKALVQFSKQIDFKEACRLCEVETVDSVHITPHHVPVTHTIKVTNILGVLPETVESYFENKYISNGGEIQKVKFYADQDYCLLSFKDVSVVQNVCGKKDHRIKGEKVNVEPYLEVLQPSKCEKIKLPDPIVLKNEDLNKMKFVKRQQSELEEILEKCHARINWDCSPLSVECSLDLLDFANRKSLSTWEKNTQSVIDEYFKDIVVRTRKVEASPWSTVVEALKYIVIPDTVSKAVATFVKKESCCITVVAHKIKFDAAWNIIHNTIDKAEESYHQEKAIVKEEKVLSAWKILYIEKVGLAKEITRTYKGLTIDLSDTDDGKVIFAGPRNSVTSAVKDLVERLRKVVHQEIKVKPHISELVQNSHVQDYIKETFIDQYLPESYAVCGRTVTMFAMDEGDLKQMVTAFWDSISTVEIQLDEKKAELLSSPGWVKLSKSLLKKHEGFIVLTTKRELIEVFTTADLRDEIEEELHEFLSENAVYRKQLKVSPHIVKYIQKVARKRYDQEIQRGPSKTIELDENKGIITIQGTSDAIKDGVEIIQKFEKSITVQKHTIQHHKIKEYFESVKGKECLLKVQEAVPCVVHVQGAVGASSTVELFDKLVCCAEVDHSSGVKIQVFGGDILSLNADVLVNPANKHLEHNGGLANIIARKGGRRIAEECKDHVSKHGPLSGGDVFVSTAGKLNSKIVVHAVGPRWSGGDHGETDSLKKAITECLKTASGKNMKTIAIPALCTGKFRYPTNLACVAIVEAVDVYLQEQGGSIEKVLFCDISVSTVQAFTHALKGIFQDVQLHGKLTLDAKKFRDSNSCNIGNVQISVINGLLTKEKVDVIVNSTSKRLKLDSGRSSAAILRSAGDTIQQECQQKYPDGINYGQVAITSGGKMSCSHIFHVTIDKYDSNNGTTCFQQMDQCVTSCLQEASKLGLKSISFPAMGTGLQKYPKKEVAKQMMKSTHNFCQNNTGTSLKTVHFVIYTGEDNTYDIFQTELVKYSSRDRSGSVSHGMDTSKPVDGDFCHVTIYADNKHDASKAVRKLEETVKKEWQIKKIEDGNIHKLGTNDITKLKTTAQSKGVHIVVDTDVGSIEIIGLDVDVLEISHRITERLRSIEKWDGKKEKARLMAATVQWCYVKNQLDCPFPDVTNLDVENAYQQKAKSIKVKDGKKVEYEITFASMTEVEINNPGNTFTVKRNDLKTVASVGVPSFWQPMAANVTLAMVPLAPGTPEYQKVVGDFQRTLGRVPTIAKVERVQNKILYTQYQTKRTQFDQTTPNFERVLWHGTAEATIPVVNQNGFNRSYSKSGLKGVYFAVNASYSDGGYARVCSDGYKRMYRCLVLTGKVSTATAGTLGPPPLNPAVPHILYDSVWDNPANPVMFIIFNDTQAYPEHLISYK